MNWRGQHAKWPLCLKTYWPFITAESSVFTVKQMYVDDHPEDFTLAKYVWLALNWAACYSERSYVDFCWDMVSDGWYPAREGFPQQLPALCSFQIQVTVDVFLPAHSFAGLRTGWAVGPREWGWMLPCPVGLDACHHGVPGINVGVSPV